MSLTSYVGESDTALLLDRIIPLNLERPTGSILAPPQTKNYSKVGTAFDYMLRFELWRRCPHAVTESWVAESAVQMLERLSRAPRTLSLDSGAVVHIRQEVSPDTFKTAKTILDQARAYLERYRVLQEPEPPDIRTLARHSLLLANLDPIRRRGYSGWDLEEADDDDVEDLVNLLEIVPYASLSDSSTVFLNPTFGWGSELVGGADADLIVGDTLIDIKTTKNLRLERSLLRQVIGYYILSEIARIENPEFPRVNSIGAYFPRYAQLWRLDCENFTAGSVFEDVKRAFVHSALEKGHGMFLLFLADDDERLTTWLHDWVGREAVTLLQEQWNEELERLRSQYPQSLG